MEKYLENVDNFVTLFKRPQDWLNNKKGFTGKNNRFPLLDILGYLKNTHKNPRFGKVRQVPANQGIPNQVPWLGLVSFFQIWGFCGYSLNTLKYPKMGICYFFLCLFIVESALSSSSQSTGTPLIYLETNNSKTM